MAFLFHEGPVICIPLIMQNVWRNSIVNIDEMQMHGNDNIFQFQMMSLLLLICFFVSSRPQTIAETEFISRFEVYESPQMHHTDYRFGFRVKLYSFRLNGRHPTFYNLQCEKTSSNEYIS